MKMQSFEKFIVNSRLWNFFYTRFRLPRVFALVEGDLGLVVVELGCGAGFTTREILQRYPHVQVIAIDYDPAQVEAARQRLAHFGRRVEVKQADATTLPIPDASVDAAFEFNVFHHIREYEKAMEEVRRVLKPGGAFYAMDLSQPFFTLPLVRSLFPPEALFSKEEFIQRLEANGLRVQRARGNNLMFYLAAERI